MSIVIEYKNDINNAKEDAQGSDGRLNVSGRVDGRRYYNSRDRGQTYTIVWEHLPSATGEYVFYLKNTSTDKTLVLSSIGLNSEVATRFQLETVTGTPAGGNTLTPFNSNTSAPHDAVADVMEGGSSASGITGLTIDEKIDQAWCQATGHEEFRMADTVRIKQNQAIAIKCVENAGGDVAGVIFMYYEQD